MGKLENHLFGYDYLSPLAPGESYGTNIKAKRKLTGSQWAGKISRALPIHLENFSERGAPYVRTVDFRDLDDRATLGFRLAGLAGLKTLKTRIVHHRQISGLDFASIPHDKVSQNVFLSEFKGQSLTDYLKTNGFASFESSDIANKDEAIKSFVFNLWIGNYDNKDRDYLVDENKNLISIDYHGSGPGFVSNPDLALGAWGEAFDIKDPNDTGWCIGSGGLLEYLKNSREKKEIFAQQIEAISRLTPAQIKKAMRGLNFYNQGTNQNINPQYLQFLLNRKLKLKVAIDQWYDAGCPLAHLPKENGIV